MPLKPIEQACLETARRVVCGDLGEIIVYEDKSFLVNTAHFKLSPSRDPVDALIVALSRAMQKHLRGVELSKLRHDLMGSGLGVEMANLVNDHLVSFTVEDWDAIRARADFYAEFNVETRLPDTDNEGDS